MKTKKTILLFSLLLLVIGVSSCNHYVDHSLRQTYSEANTEIYSGTTKIDFIKIHLENGDVSVLDSWSLNSANDSIIGQGKLYDFNRSQIQEGDLSFSIDEITILEINGLDSLKPLDKQRTASLAVLTGLNIAMGIICIVNPNNCAPSYF